MAGSANAPAAENAHNERCVREHIAAATAALNQPGGGRARLWQSKPIKAINPCLLPRLRGKGSVGLAGRQNHDDLAAFEARFLLDLGDFRGVDLDPV
jgi:hypothetical protein